MFGNNPTINMPGAGGGGGESNGNDMLEIKMFSLADTVRKKIIEEHDYKLDEDDFSINLCMGVLSSIMDRLESKVGRQMVDKDEDLFNSHYDAIHKELYEHLQLASKSLKRPEAQSAAVTRPQTSPPPFSEYNRVNSYTTESDFDQKYFKSVVSRLTEEFPNIDQATIPSIVSYHYANNQLDYETLARSHLEAINRDAAQPGHGGEVPISGVGSTGVGRYDSFEGSLSPSQSATQLLHQASTPSPRNSVVFNNSGRFSDPLERSFTQMRRGRPSSQEMDHTEVEGGFQLVNKFEVGLDLLQKETNRLRSKTEEVRQTNEELMNQNKQIVSNSCDPLLEEFYRLALLEEKMKEELVTLKQMAGQK